MKRTHMLVQILHCSSSSSTSALFNPLASTRLHPQITQRNHFFLFEDISKDPVRSSGGAGITSESRSLAVQAKST